MDNRPWPDWRCIHIRFPCVMIHIANIPQEKSNQFDQIMRSRDQDVNSIPGITCRVWLVVILRAVVQAGLVRCSSVEALLQECMAFEINVRLQQQPTPSHDRSSSRSCVLESGQWASQAYKHLRKLCRSLILTYSNACWFWFTSFLLQSVLECRSYRNTLKDINQSINQSSINLIMPMYCTTAMQALCRMKQNLVPKRLNQKFHKGSRQPKRYIAVFFQNNLEPNVNPFADHLVLYLSRSTSRYFNRKIKPAVIPKHSPSFSCRI